jgi:hypothetical protein
MSDVQRAIALILIGTLAATAFLIAIRLVIWGDAAALLDMAKTLQSNLTNMALIALGFFFGSTIQKALSDAGQQKIVEKLTSSTPPATGPVAPLAAPPEPVVVVAWSSKLTEAERAAIASAANAGDARVAAFITAADAGKASPDDLTYLVGKGLLTQERATQIQST